jgi:hypothetical protein
MAVKPPFPLRKYEARAVLAGAYRARAEERATLIHYYDVTDAPLEAAKTLCGRVPADSLCDVAEPAATCAECVARFYRRASKGLTVFVTVIE